MRDLRFCSHTFAGAAAAAAGLADVLAAVPGAAAAALCCCGLGLGLEAAALPLRRSLPFCGGNSIQRRSPREIDVHAHIYLQGGEMGHPDVVVFRAGGAEIEAAVARVLLGGDLKWKE